MISPIPVALLLSASTDSITLKPNLKKGDVYQVVSSTHSTETPSGKMSNLTRVSYEVKDAQANGLVIQKRVLDFTSSSTGVWKTIEKIKASDNPSLIVNGNIGRPAQAQSGDFLFLYPGRPTSVGTTWDLAIQRDNEEPVAKLKFRLDRFDEKQAFVSIEPYLVADKRVIGKGSVILDRATGLISSGSVTMEMEGFTISTECFVILPKRH